MKKTFILSAIAILFIILIGIEVDIIVRNEKKTKLPPENTKTRVDTTGWKSADIKDNFGNEIKYKYPDFPAVYIHPQYWPPSIVVSGDEFSCKEGGLGSNGLPGVTVEKSMNSGDFCIQSIRQGTAGTVYTDYTYTLLKYGKLLAIKFSLGYTQCENYQGPKLTECKNERQSFDPDILIDDITMTIQF